ncbi:hypothetical protein QFW77_02120 [Luteimonas sp. RD2P54]|uniref:Secreted protein n=1 Tax=Luteimonas endophytica TaxID=3042023 RepID=A0ABT6J4P3_9GAMM|nr:hypothetical protein [Luteimonas endophytica]MDH5821793.1 hypothetical protein [Luteimonas endophytica]
MRAATTLLLLLALPMIGHASDCARPPATSSALRPTVLAPLSSELAAPSYRLGAQGGVLSHAYDEAQSVDQVLLRLRLEGCRNVASAMPAPTPVDPLDPSVYKPLTEHDNTPWRFDMSQNGRMMTADEFDAWMKARGVRVARGAPKPAAVALPAPPPAEGDAAVPPGTAEAAPAETAPAASEGTPEQPAPTP